MDLQRFQDSYRYTLNGVYHEIRDPRIMASSNTHLRSREKHLVSQKFLLKYLHDLFEHHQIDYALFHETLRGQDIFQGVNIFEKKIEICLMYRPLQTILGSDLLQDGFFLDFESPYFAVISTQFFDSITVKAHLYLLRRDPDDPSKLLTLHPSYVLSRKKYTEIDLANSPSLQDREYKLISIPLSSIFPPHKAPYEDFEVYLPHKTSHLLSTQGPSHSASPKEEKEEESQNPVTIPILQQLFSFMRSS